MCPPSDGVHSFLPSESWLPCTTSQSSCQDPSHTRKHRPERQKSDSIPVSKPRDDHDGPKGFLLGYEHVVLHVREDSWLKEEACRGDRGLWYIGGAVRHGPHQALGHTRTVQMTHCRNAMVWHLCEGCQNLWMALPPDRFCDPHGLSTKCCGGKQGPSS